MISKLMTMPDAVRLVLNGQMLAVGGNALHRTPAAFCQELAMLKRTHLKGVGAAPGFAMDVLCAAESMNEVYFGFFGFENEYGLAPGMRKGIQSGKIKAIEGS